MNRLSTNIKEAVNSNRVLSLGQLITFIKEIRTMVGTHSDNTTGAPYWNLCAINEITELAREYSWEVWKPGDAINFDAAALEAVDVLAFLVAKVTSYKNDSGFKKISYSRVSFYNPTSPTHKLDEVDITPSHVVKYVSSIIRHIQNVHTFNQEAFIVVVTLLAKLTHMTEGLFSAFVIAKLSLVACRLENGKYIANWNKIAVDGKTTEVDMLTAAVHEFIDNPHLTLCDLLTIVELRSKDFIYIKGQSC